MTTQTQTTEQVYGASRDASSYDRPDTRRPKRVHVATGDLRYPIAACSGAQLDPGAVWAAERWPTSVRCRRPGCANRWPVAAEVKP